MKKIINGSRYDTDTAKHIGSASSTALPGDFDYWESDLYRTKAGKYFLYRQGFGYPVEDNHLGFGSEIIPLDESTARQWAEKCLDADKYEAAFGAVTEDARFTVVLPESLLDKLDARKAADNKSRSEIVIAALLAYL